MKRYKAIVIGGGPGGYAAAIRLGKSGVDTLLIDRDGLGGVCIREGCIPSKALLHQTADLQPDAVRQNAPDDPVLGGLRKHSQEATRRLMQGIAFLLKKAGVTHVNGWGKILGSNRVQVQPVQGAEFEAQGDNLVIASGSKPFDPIGLPTDDRVWNSSQALALPFVPGSMVVAGGGYVGLELAQIYTRLGAQVTVIEMMDHVLPQMSADVARQVAMSLKRQGVQVITGARIRNVRTDKALSVEYERRGKTVEIQADCLLNAVGRRPRTDGFGLESLDIQMTDRGFVFVDDTMRTSRSGVYVIGDLAGPPMLAHKAYAEARVAAMNIAGQPTALKARAIPSIVFTDPPAGVVGMVPTSPDNYIRGQFPMTASGRAVAESETAGFVRVWADAESHELVACEAVGKAVETVIAEATLAVQNHLTLEAVEDTVHTHPTYAEAFAEACEVALKHPLHIP